VTRQQALRQACEMLMKHNIESAALTAEVLLRHALQITKVQLYQDPNSDISIEQGNLYQQYLERHIIGEPVAYITNHKEFYGLDFYVDPNVLIPRPETEILVDQAIELTKNKPVTIIADVGTGSGAIAITLAKYTREVKIYAVDVSPLALETAKDNSRRHGVESRITFLQGDMLEPLPEPVDLIVANLPYVKTADLNEPSIRYEPKQALDGGVDGLEQMRRFCVRLTDRLRPCGAVVMEIGQGQDMDVVRMLRQIFPLGEIETFSDYAGIRRVVMFILSQLEIGKLLLDGL